MKKIHCFFISDTNPNDKQLPIFFGEQFAQNMKQALLINLLAAFYNALKKKLLLIAYPFRAITSGLPNIYIDPGNSVQYTISNSGYPKLLYDRRRMVAFSAFENPSFTTLKN